MRFIDLRKRATQLLESIAINAKVPSRLITVFDMDDTLLITKPLVIRAYELAGVAPDFTEKNWGKPSSAWVLPGVHRSKQRHYANLARSNPPSRTAVGYLAMLLENSSYTLTSANIQSYEMLQSVCGFMPPLLSAGCSLEQKHSILINKVRDGSTVMYFDDNPDAIRGMLRLTETYPMSVEDKDRLIFARVDTLDGSNTDVVSFMNRGGWLWTA